MDSAALRKTFATRILKLRKDKLGINQGEFADTVGVSRGAMSYYEQEARTPDIGVLRAICEKYNISADYMIGLNADENHAVSDVCRKTGLSPKAVKVLSAIEHSKPKGELFPNYENVFSHFVDVFSDQTLQMFPSMGPITEVLNVLLENEDGLQLLTLLSAIILGVNTRENEQDEIFVSINSKTNSQLLLPISIKELSASLWLNIQYFANNLRDMQNPQSEVEPLPDYDQDTIQVLQVNRDNPDQQHGWQEVSVKDYEKSRRKRKNSKAKPSDTI